MDHFVYILFHPVTEEVFYVGITNHAYKRFKQHITEKEDNSGKNERIREIKASKLMPGMRVLEIVDSFETAKVREMYWIQYYLDLGIPLTNISKPRSYEPVKDEAPKDDEIGLLDVAEVKRLLNISRPTLYKLMERGILKAVEKPSYLERRQRLRFRESDIRRLLLPESKEIPIA